MNKKTLFFIIISVFLLAACGSSAPVPVTDISEIVGIWKSDPPGMTMKILPDGSVPTDITLAKINEGARWEFKYWFEEGKLIMRGWTTCIDESVGTYDVQILANGNLEFNVVEDNCWSRVNGYMGQREEPVIDTEWVRVDE